MSNIKIMMTSLFVSVSINNAPNLDGSSSFLSAACYALADSFAYSRILASSASAFDFRA